MTHNPKLFARLRRLDELYLEADAATWAVIRCPYRGKAKRELEHAMRIAWRRYRRLVKAYKPEEQHA